MRYFILILFIVSLSLGLYFTGGFFQKQVTFDIIQPSDTPKPTIITPTPKFSVQDTYIYLASVPFAAQAPFGNWKDPLEQNGCEEAASIIAVYWARNKSLTKQQMLDEIIAVSAYETKTYGNSVDTSSQDTLARIIQGYYHYTNVDWQQVTSVDQIVSWLGTGNLVITPMNGQKILNHNYTAPGPERHMIVIRGYDPKTDEFITNDAGTRLGEDFRYPQDNFFSAIRDYPTGDHNPFVGTPTKSAILVWK